MKKSMLAIVFLAGGVALMNAQTTDKATKTKTTTDAKIMTPEVSQSATVELQTDTLAPEIAVKRDAAIKVAPDSAQKAEAKDLKQNEAIRKTDAKKPQQ